jgi:hypothetical protein
MSDKSVRYRESYVSRWSFRRDQLAVYTGEHHARPVDGRLSRIRREQRTHPA